MAGSTTSLIWSSQSVEQVRSELDKHSQFLQTQIEQYTQEKNQLENRLNQLIGQYQENEKPYNEQ